MQIPLPATWRAALTNPQAGRCAAGHGDKKKVGAREGSNLGGPGGLHP